MNNIFFLIMRKMRLPLLVLVTVYAVIIIGMTLVPGETDTGEVYYMDFFHAFYFVSFMVTTIGFGEIPYDFSGAQRLWVMFALYLGVVAWIYAIGALLALIQDKALQRAMVEQRFARQVRHLREDFYLVCGYGDTGRALVSAFEKNLMRTVVIENNQERINGLHLEDYPVYVPALCADASKPRFLHKGGLRHPHCRAVVAVTNDNFVNLHVAITSKLLNPNLPVLCRVETADVEGNMLSFGTDYTINPFYVFASRLTTALHSPNLYLLRDCLVGNKSFGSCPLLNPPKKGLWLLCGYGRFGRAIYKELILEPDVELIIVDAVVDKSALPEGVEFVLGRGTESDTLNEARIQDAVGIVAGTDNDVDNLSIVMTARGINDNLFIVMRQNLADNQIIFDAAHADVVMQASQIIAEHIRVLLTIPLLRDFMMRAKQYDENWTRQLIDVIKKRVTQQPILWETKLTPVVAPAVCERFAAGKSLTLECLLHHPADRNNTLACIPLMLVRKEKMILLPDETETLCPNDRILWCGEGRSEEWMSWALQESFVLDYMISGKIISRSWIWRWLQRDRNAT